MVLSWHATTYLILMSDSTTMILDNNSNEELDKNQVINDV
uniref:Uncharacterized protein n=1 Tax=Physcomitrium patens TaxID=3218 RepID=A0A7I4DEE6_PHYPA